jgi:hypothetical protein
VRNHPFSSFYFNNKTQIETKKPNDSLSFFFHPPVTEKSQEMSCTFILKLQKKESGAHSLSAQVWTCWKSLSISLLLLCFNYILLICCSFAGLHETFFFFEGNASW